MTSQIYCIYLYIVRLPLLASFSSSLPEKQIMLSQIRDWVYSMWEFDEDVKRTTGCSVNQNTIRFVWCENSFRFLMLHTLKTKTGLSGIVSCEHVSHITAYTHTFKILVRTTESMPNFLAQSKVIIFTL